MSHQTSDKITLTLYNLLKTNKVLCSILLLSLVLNIFYAVVVSDILLGDQKYIGGDTSGWTDSFINLLEKGSYTFDLTNKNASFGRVPGFSFFWGIHYLLVGPTYVYQAVACTQVLLGVWCTYLIFSIALKIYPYKNVALLSAFIYATYPFTMYWITVSYAEPLSNFINLLCINILLLPNKRNHHFVFLGILSALAFYTREFMGFILIIALVYIFFDATIFPLRKKIQSLSLVFISFLLLYGIWPLRNYVYHDRILWSRDYNAFNLFNDHFLSYTDWVLCWDNNEHRWIEAAVMNASLDFPNDIFENSAEEKKAKQLITKANRCATSFLYWRQVLTGVSAPLPRIRCDDTIQQGFEELRHSFITHHPWRYLFDVPLRNVYKVFFKNELQTGSMITKSPVQSLYTLVFGYRTTLLLLAVAGLVISWKNYRILPIASFMLFMIVYMCFIFRYIEMRNFMQTDVLLIIPGSYFLYFIYQLCLPKNIGI